MNHEEKVKLVKQAYLNNKLLPCPFCGSGSRRLFIEDSVTGSFFWVECATSDNGCGACGPIATLPEYAIKFWNKRSNGNEE